MEKEKVLFISEIQDPYTKGSSTQIMTENIINGLNLISDVHFIAIVDWDSDKSEVKRYFESKVDRLTIIDSKLQIRKIKNKYYRQLKLLKFSIGKFNDFNLKDIYLDKYDKIITHSPSIESIKVGELLRKKIKNKNIKIYQYWSDPLAISGIYPEDLSLKRFILISIERIMHSKADRIVFGTRTLYESQKKIYSNPKFSYSDVSYIEESDNVYSDRKGTANIVLGYSGQYNSNVRNIKPLYNIFIENELQNLKLVIVGDSDLQLSPNDNVEIINNRISQSNIRKLEKDFDVIITLLNKDCIQIPGKLFYNVNSIKPIVVILDGLYKDDIRDYLNSFERFIFVENDEKEILNLLQNLEVEFMKVNNLKAKTLLSPSIVSKQILIGGLTDYKGNNS